MDDFGSRADLLASLDMIVALGSKIQKERASAQVDLFGSSNDPTTAIPDVQLIKAEEVPPSTMLLWERELLGLYLSSHPLEDYDTYLDENAVAISSLSIDHHDQTATIGGTISDIRQITTKNGQPMAFVKLEDRSGEIELVIFPSLFKDTADKWQRDNVITVVGRISGRHRDGSVMNEVKFLPDSIETISLDTAKNYKSTGAKKEVTKSRVKSHKTKAFIPRPSSESKLFIRIEDESDPTKLVRIKTILDESSGDKEVILVFGADKKQALKLPYKVAIAEDLTRQLAEIVGAVNVVVQ